VTVAHEYFHATQFAYDYLEDSWFLEATATWAEDELYDDVDDNLQYLPSGPLGAPKLSLDLFGGSHHYGDWIFFRYLTERFPALRGGLPSLILDMFIKADASKGGADQYSAQAISAVLKERGTSFAKMFTKFADANLDPGANYEEGAANDYPVAPYRTFGHSQGWYTTKLDHMSSASMYFEPSDATTQELKLTVDLASKSTSPAAIVSVHLVGGGVQTSQIPLNQNGNGSKVFPFAQSTVSWVDFTLVNASARFDPCWDNSPYSCSGKPVDENLVAKIKGAVR
jgi:hypothetical protein